MGMSIAHRKCPQPPAQRPPDSLRGHADTGPPLSRGGRLYLKPASGGRPTDARLVVEPESAFFPFRGVHRTPVLEKHATLGKWGAWLGALSTNTPSAMSRRRMWQAAPSADHWLPQTHCMGACHLTLVCAPGASLRLRATHRATFPAECSTQLPCAWIPCSWLCGTRLATHVRSPHALMLVQWRLVAI